MDPQQEEKTSQKHLEPCVHCGKSGHKDSACFKNMTCERCKRKGHPTKICKATEWCTVCALKYNAFFRNEGEEMFANCRHFPTNCQDAKKVKCKECNSRGHTEEFHDPDYWNEVKNFIRSQRDEMRLKQSLKKISESQKNGKEKKAPLRTSNPFAALDEEDLDISD